jgi:hypothetical protein
VDLGRLQAGCARDRGYRQLRPRAEQVKAEPIAAELADAISATGRRQQHPRIAIPAP